MNSQSNTNPQNNSTAGKIKRIAKFLLGFPLTLLSLYFVLKFINTNYQEVAAHIQNLNIPSFVAGFFFLLLFFLIRSLAWIKLLEGDGFSPKDSQSIYLLSVSEIKRYIPGSVIGFVSRVNNFNILKIPAKITLKLILYEGIIFVLSAALLSIPSIIYMLQKSNQANLTLIAEGTTGIIIALIIFRYLVFNRLPKKIRDLFTELPKFKTSFFLMIVAWALFGVGNYLVASSLNYLDPRKIIEFSSIFVLSWLIGYVVIIAPLGLGVREAAVTYGLAFAMPVSIAAAISILTRLALILVEIFFLSLSFIAYKLKLKKRFDYYFVTLWSLIVSYISYFSYLSFEKHLNFFTGRFDLGNMDQTVWNTIHGRMFELTDPNSTQITSRLAFHADFILIFLAPFYLLWEDPRMLLLIQSVVIGFGAYFVYKISELVLKNRAVSLAFAASYLLNPLVQKQNLFDFHGVTLATTFLLAAFYFSLKKKSLFVLLFLGLSVLTKENVYAISFLFGIYLAFKNRERKWLGLSFISIILFYLIVSKLIPGARGGQHFAVEYFSDFGDTPMTITRNIILQPLKTVSELLKLTNLEYLYKLFLPVGFLSIFAPFYLIFASPDLLINMLSNNNNLTSINYHYAATIIPFIYISSIFACAFLLNHKNKFVNYKTLTVFILIFAFISTYEYGTLPGAKSPTTEIYTSYLPIRSQIDKFLNRIPASLSVASSNNLGAHLSHRERIYTIPNGMDQADVILFLLNDPYAQPSPVEQKRLASALEKDTKYVELYRIGDFVAFARKDRMRFIKM